MAFRKQDHDKRYAAASRRYAWASLFIFAMMLGFPSLAYSAPIRAVFADWSLVAAEFALFFLTLATLFLAGLNDPKRVDEDGRVDLHWPP